MSTNKVGPPVTGEAFFDREDEQRELWEYLGGGDVLLLAPRRVGKTSLMYRLRETAEEQGFEAAYLSVAGAEDEIGFVRKLCDAVSSLPSGSVILRHLDRGPLSRLLKRVKKLGSLELGDGDPWQDLGAKLAEELDRHEGRRLLLVDEVPVFVLSLLRKDSSAERARRFLSWLRDLRQQPDRQSRLRWLLAGSIGLDTVTARLRLGDTINDLYLFRLGPFERETARNFLRTMSNAYAFPITEDVLEHILDRIGWLIPYYLQLLFLELRTSCEHLGITPSLATVDKVFEDLLSPSKKSYFDYWRQRLEEELGRPDAGMALGLLNAAALDPKGASRTTLKQQLSRQIEEPEARDDRFRYLIDVLENDGYLVTDGKRYRFRSPLLREFWLRRVVP